MIREGTQLNRILGSECARAGMVDRLERTVSRTIDDHEIKRHGSTDHPALLIEQKDGHRVLSLHSEAARDD